jgi:acyl-CoA reductase-like NAD-dependent aldehyde dehydrogenase
LLVAKTRALKMGDPKEEDTFIGPVISEKEGRRIKDWIDRAIEAGGKRLCGGGRKGAMVEATLLEDVPADQPICAEEVFGPVAVLSKFHDFADAVRLANDSAFGLQAGVFTNNLSRALRAWDELVVGGVVVNDVPSWRVDNMPYGGVKDSGLGREGIRYAIEDMTEPRLLVIRERIHRT